MAAKQCPDRYYDRMKSSGDDKLKITKFLSDGDSVLDVGAGGGVLAELLLETFPSMTVTALDPSNTATARLHALAGKFPGRLSVVQTDFFAFESEEKFDAVVFCSSLHEIFSYTEYEGKRYEKAVVSLALDHAAQLLKSHSGKIIVRDGVAARHNPKVMLQYIDKGMKDLAERYENEFTGFPLKITHTMFGDIMPYNSMMELLYTITWGEESFAREVQEWYGYYSLDDWRTEEKRLAIKFGLFLTCAEKYLQSGYKEHLNGKVILRSAPLMDWDGNLNSKLLELPASNCIVVFERGRCV